MPRDVHIDTAFAWPPLGFLAAILIFTALTIWFYRTTLPPVSSVLRTVLVVLRSIVLFCIGLLLFQPIFHLSYPSREKPVVTILIDTSASMQTVYRGRSGAQILQTLLRSEAFRAFGKRYATRFFLFSNTFQTSTNPPESLVFDGTATDMAGALENVLDTRPDAILLFSDGIVNAGKNPVRTIEQAGPPVYGVILGDSSEKADVMISSVQANDFVYAGNQAPLKIAVRGPGFGGKTTEITLNLEGMVLDRTRVQLPRDGMAVTAELKYRFETAGFHKLTAALSPSPGEATLNNNVQELYIEVLKSKMKVLLLADAPSSDLAFIKRVISSDPNVALQVCTLKKDGSIFEGSFPGDRELKETDEIWLLDVPSRFYPESLWQKISLFIQRDGKPFLLIAGPNLDTGRCSSLGLRLPVQFGDRGSEMPVLAFLTREGRVHPLFQIETAAAKSEPDLPPVFSSWPQVRVDPPSRILAEAVPEKARPGSETKIPLIVIRSSGDQKSMVILARGLFRWQLMMQARGQGSDVFKTWIGHFVRWLGVREEQKPVRLSVSRSVCRAGEDNTFSVQVYDEAVEPVEGADVQIRFLNPADRQELRLSDEGNGMYQTVFRPLEEGRFRVVAEAFLEDRILGRDTTEFSVSPFNPEFLDTRARPEFMAMLAEESGGRSGPPDSLKAILDGIRIQPRILIRKTEWEFSFRPVMLALILILLCAEWLIRRRKGML